MCKLIQSVFIFQLNRWRLQSWMHSNLNCIHNSNSDKTCLLFSCATRYNEGLEPIVVYMICVWTAASKGYSYVADYYINFLCIRISDIYPNVVRFSYWVTQIFYSCKVFILSVWLHALMCVDKDFVTSKCLLSCLIKSQVMIALPR